MKEFVEKLIERLEEKSFIMQCADNRYHNFINIDKIKNSINQLAEEFATDINVGSKKQGWIPVMERLPEENKDGWTPIMLSIKTGEVIFGLWHDETIGFCKQYKDGVYKAGGVIAWQPLPEPYKPEETQSNFYSERFNKVL